MAFDPTLPPDAANVKAAVLRAQFNGLNDKIDATLPLSVVIDGVTGLPPGAPPSFEVSLVGNVLHFSVGIPAGTPGTDGGQGIQGETGAQGEVSRSDLDDAIAGTARNPIGVAALSLGSSDPVIQEIEDKINEMLTETKRT
ncbi:MAG: hypothetical protein ABMA13_06190 [Chthoniobacteraceae bacterium]